MKLSQPVPSLDIQNKVTNLVDNSASKILDVMQRNVKLADKNSDHIADNIKLDTPYLDALILFNDKAKIPQSLSSFGGSITKRFDQWPIIQATIPSNMINAIARIPGLSLIEQNYKLQTYLEYSTSQLGVRPYVWDMGLLGSSSSNVAVIDSGVDTTHVALQGRIAYTHNFLTGTSDVTDDVGHGTFVSHIIAGSMDTGNGYIQSSRGTIPSTGLIVNDILIANLNVTTDITVGVKWGGGSIEYGLYQWNRNSNSLVQCSGCLATDGSGQSQTTFSSISPGDYYVVLTDNGGSVGQAYEMWASVPNDSQTPKELHGDQYPNQSGIAPESKIVALKVTDASNSGTVSTFLSAMQWVTNNHDLYNITVVNLSIGISSYSAEMDTAVATLTQQGVVVVVAAGNSGAATPGVGSPASAEEAITVGAVNRYNEVAFYSSNGASDPNINVIKPDVLAPGGSQALPGYFDTSYQPGDGLIISADSNTLGYNLQSNDLTGEMGTSFAAPHVAGIALLCVEQLMKNNEWLADQSSVFRVKRAILSGTFEVGNIGSAGGEAYPPDYPNQSPSINRISKDYVEGWGAVQAQAVIGALNVGIGINQVHNVTFGLNDPFTPNVYAWNYNFEQGVDYNFMATVPPGADIDLLVFNADSGTYGDLLVLASSTNGPGINESINLNFPSNVRGILVARLVDSSNTYDQSEIQLYFPNFTPHVQITSPINGSYVPSSSFNLQYTSQSSDVLLFIDGVNQGAINPNYQISGLSEGIHNITIFEQNQVSGLSDADTSIITVDLTNPVVTSAEFTALNGQTLSDPVIINFSATDNFQLFKIELVGNGDIGLQEIVSGNSLSSSFIFNPTNFAFGPITLILRVYDQSGRTDDISISIQLNHQIYVIPHFFEGLDGDSGNKTITWDEAANNPLNYSISINGTVVSSGAWDGSNIQFDTSNLDLGYYDIQLIIFDVSLQNATDTFVLHVYDKTAPRLSSQSSGKYDANSQANIAFSIDERFPMNYTILVNDVVFKSENVQTVPFTLVSFSLENTPGNIDSIKLMVTDTSYNTAQMTISITWADDVIPVITKSNDISFVKGKASDSIGWSWVEKFPSEVLVLLDGAVYTQVSDLTLTSFSIVSGQLDSLNVGNHEYKLQVTDLGGNVVSARILVEVTQATSNKGRSFIPLSTPIFIASVALIGVIAKHRKHQLSSTK